MVTVEQLHTIISESRFAFGWSGKRALPAHDRDPLHHSNAARDFFAL